MAETVLVVNGGSSSLKLGLFGAGGEVWMRGAADGIGKSGGSLVMSDGAGDELHRETLALGSAEEALAHGIKRMRGLGLPTPTAVGHRVVHGGPKLLEHCRVTAAVEKTLRESVHFAPLHIPGALRLMAEAEKELPGVAQFACFDTVFHETMPEVAKRLPLPEKYWEEGVRRYGFHGLSYESIVYALRDELPARMIVAHLGSGCSVAAIRDGRSVDTSMGLTPTGGVMMSTRTGDLDPGVVLYLLRAGVDGDALETMLNHASGLVAVAGHGGDMRAIEQDGGVGAEMGLAMFYGSVAKMIAGFATVLGGVDALVFTGGIGEHSERARREICGRVGFLGVGDGRVVAAEEEGQIGRICFGLMGGG